MRPKRIADLDDDRRLRWLAFAEHNVREQELHERYALGGPTMAEDALGIAIGTVLLVAMWCLIAWAAGCMR